MDTPESRNDKVKVTRRDQVKVTHPITTAVYTQLLMTLCIALEQTHAGPLRADVLKVPHHGSETASTQAFINAVAPRFAIISASTKHHLPRETVVERYVHGSRVILRTDQNSANDTDHITCFVDSAGELDCNYEQVLIE